METMLEQIANAIADALVGGWDMSLQILLIVIGLDYLTGVACAFKTKAVSSSVGYKGLIKKSTIFIIVILAAQMDRMIGVENDLFRNCTAIFFTVNDALSILENAGKMGMKLPAFLKSTLVKLQQKVESTGNTMADQIDQDSEKNNNTKQEKNNDEKPLAK